MVTNNKKWIALGLCILLAGFGALLAESALQPDTEKRARGLLALQDSEETCRTKEDPGSTVPYPVSGSLALSPQETQSLNASLPMDMGGLQRAEVWVFNSEERAATVLFLGEDGNPRAKAFVRPREQVKMDLQEGSYDARFESGTDWLGERFGACSGRGKVKGIIVAKPGALSKVELSATARFVVGNRLDLDVARQTEKEVLARAKLTPIEERGPAASGREARDERPATAMVRGLR